MILTIVGARPQFVKAAVVSKALIDNGITEHIIHTGQHYDDSMSNIFWKELNIPPWTINLNVGSAHHGRQTAQMIEKIEEYILSNNGRYRAVMVYGDTNSTLAGAIVASKLHLQIIHVEAGLRSFNRLMPEEINRILTDSISDYLFCPSEMAVKNLENENVVGQIFNCGDVMQDAVKTFLPIALQKVDREKLVGENVQEYSLLTIHRPANVDNTDNLNNILKGLGEIEQKIIWPVHPRTRKALNAIQVPGNIQLAEPFSYFEMLASIYHCNKVITDSGGLQKESYWLKKPCITLRTETEWTETLHNGWNTLVPDFSDSSVISQVHSYSVRQETWKPLYGAGNASRLLASTLKERIKW